MLPWEAPPRAPIFGEPDPPAPLWIPEEAEPAPPEEPIRSPILPALPIAVLVGALITAAIFGGPRLFGGDQPKSTRPAAVAPVAPEPAPVPILEDDDVRLVTIDPAVTDPRAEKVAATFETFFTGINERDYTAVAGVLDPAGELDPQAPGQMAAFAKGTSTTRDADVVLRNLDPAGAGRARAEVTFRSSQRAGHGPPGRPNETCTRWRVIYLLSPDGGRYRIRQADAVTEPC
ncbi:hypothetical protein [Actinoplanes derwentensis]|uniref:hypothetical protein n=1 Tax=Actinoplanes derwentensis TaxID=113562 RepID=UPI000B818474|nr:hypothetical protein [Actinoplanes derwentensis]GID84177.1 hypothetical protein Ade03nite_31010 [Actinoplanes derwentensis]